MYLEILGLQRNRICIAFQKNTCRPADNTAGFLHLPHQNGLHMRKNEEYTENKSRDWLLFIGGTIAMVALLIWKPEWVWVAWPFQFTGLAGALGRL